VSEHKPVDAMSTSTTELVDPSILHPAPKNAPGCPTDRAASLFTLSGAVPARSQPSSAPQSWAATETLSMPRWLSRPISVDLVAPHDRSVRETVQQENRGAFASVDDAERYLVELDFCGHERGGVVVSGHHLSPLCSAAA
jgi:hypothetical protein